MVHFFCGRYFEQCVCFVHLLEVRLEKATSDTTPKHSRCGISMVCSVRLKQRCLRWAWGDIMAWRFGSLVRVYEMDYSHIRETRIRFSNDRTSSTRKTLSKESMDMRLVSNVGANTGLIDTPTRASRAHHCRPPHLLVVLSHTCSHSSPTVVSGIRRALPKCSR